MSKFKVGDRVVCVEASVQYAAIILLGKEYTITELSQSGSSTVRVDGIWWWHESRFELAEQKYSFDMNKEAWFIRYKDYYEFKATKEWLTENFGRCDDLVYKFMGSDKIFTNTWTDGEVCPMVLWGDNPHQSAKEIKLSFKTAIDSVEYPTVETEKDKQLRELEATIAKASEQIKALKGEK